MSIVALLCSESVILNSRGVVATPVRARGSAPWGSTATGLDRMV